MVVLLRIFIILPLLIGRACASELTVGFDPQVASQGKTFAVYVDSEKPFNDASALFLGQKIKLYFVDGRFRGLIGIPPEQKAGRYKVKIFLTREGGTSQEIEKTMEVRPTRFASTWFRLKPAKKKLYVPDLIQKEWAEIEKKLLVEESEQRWQEEFMLPVKGPISMTFGTVEHINGKRTGQHRGLDIAVPGGTPVKAAESGKIVFAEKLKAFGGTIVIDHGQGVHSLYFHLSKFLTKPGQEVAKGERIALSGNSGISSGPHLHWGMSIHDVRVDPLQWTKYVF